MLAFLSSVVAAAAEPLAAELGKPFSLARGELAVVTVADLKVELVDVGRRVCPNVAACEVPDGPYALVRLARASTDATLYGGEVSSAVAKFPHFADPATREPYGVLLVHTDGQTASLVVHGAERCTLFSARRAEAQCWMQVAVFTGRQDFCERIAEPELARSCTERMKLISGDEPSSDPPLPAEGIAEIGIERTQCFGRCPSYVLVFSSDGTFRFQGRRDVARIGTFSGTIDRERFDDLARFVEDVGFMELEGSYSWNVTDAATVITTVVGDGVRKTVRNYAGGGPARLEDLEKRIDALLADARWDQ